MYIIDHKHHLLGNKSTNNTHTESISTQPKEEIHEQAKTTHN